MAITPDEAAKVAHLARIEVADSDLEGIASELSSILGFMEQLNEVDIEGVEPMSAVTPMLLKRRSDNVTSGGDSVKVLSNAPENRQGFFVVPKVVE
ncbi:MAG: Asp-tRNA(Asn)/Glu-tRNA(Gln) amidotransferase subunit GatC [Albidovulum sp.]|nr:Asp-tRNA(Asn)/Glu-tRNA(Gln) amidotransferase subunit GatC [Albidovulum sp.]MDE0305638.1 Asp-tRNA(Asn)/Glu-tRNA(Gln) amidotransferase subunit GatC [Albidovulum sp.]MDE0533640.1 Asp-tRNA(Asn)/Glu-tRNA(Gln) amidotransferase subunit GatC [Albidovulum sp.]